MISGGILQAANVPDSFNARTCSLGSGGCDKSSSEARATPRVRQPIHARLRLTRDEHGTRPPR